MQFVFNEVTMKKDYEKTIARAVSIAEIKTIHEHPFLENFDCLLEKLISSKKRSSKLIKDFIHIQFNQTKQRNMANPMTIKARIKKMTLPVFVFRLAANPKRPMMSSMISKKIRFYSIKYSECKWAGRIKRFA
jgi:hypothetical protein